MLLQADLFASSEEQSPTHKQDNKPNTQNAYANTKHTNLS